MWVGSKFYTPETFIVEAKAMGVSKRIPHVPKDLKLGDFVLLGHRKAGRVTTEAVDGKQGEVKEVPALFYGFHVTRIEKIITESQSKNTEAMAELAKRNITPIVVSDDDKDHQGTVYDKEDEPESSQSTLEAVL